MAAPPVSYRLAIGALRPLLPLLALASPRWRHGVRGRRESARRFRVDAAALAGQPVFHLHAASAGELRYAEPVLERLRREHPDWRWVVTYSSPSAEPFAEALQPDLHGFLPWDTPREVGRFLDSVKPRASLVSRLDLWPEFAAGAAARRVPVLLVAAALDPASGRLSGPGRHVLRRAYGTVAAAAAVAPEDVALLRDLGVPRERIEVLGDPRADLVRERIARDEPARRWPALTLGGPVLVAGSTWRADERTLLAAFRAVRQLHPAARLVLAPHQPSPAVLAAITREALALGLPAPQLVAGASLDAPIAVLGEVGPLALLYGAARIAYVGGGFGGGLHSVLEPAAWSLPVLVGPRWQASRDAQRLAVAGALAPLPAEAPVGVLAERWSRWLGEETDRAAAGAAARAVVDAAAGAADRTAALVERVLRDY